MWRKDLVYIRNRNRVCAKHLKISTFCGLYVSNDAEYFNRLRLAVFVGLLRILMTRSNSDNTAPEKFSSMWESTTPRSIGHAKYSRATRRGHIPVWPETYLYVKVMPLFCFCSRYVKVSSWHNSSSINAGTQSKQNWRIGCSQRFLANLWPKIDIFMLENYFAFHWLGLESIFLDQWVWDGNTPWMSLHLTWKWDIRPQNDVIQMMSFVIQSHADIRCWTQDWRNVG